MKCYKVQDKYGNGPQVPVWADSPSRAKSMVKNTEWFYDYDWKDIRALRWKDADNYKQDEYHMAYASISDIRYLRGMGWYEWDNAGDACKKCGLEEWRALKESHIGDDGLCEECRKTERT